MVKLERRDRVFGLGAVPRRWHGGKASVSTFFDNLSVFFPAGERFFVRSVRRFVRPGLAPELAARAADFAAQEAFHGREHRSYNAMLRAQGYPVDAMEARVERLLALAEAVLPASSKLAVTCGLEHLTALLAHLLLSDDRRLEGADETMAALWRWHAAEENEHKSVAFDLYRASGGGELERCAIMALASVIFWAKVLEHQARMMKADGLLFSADEWRALYRYLFVDPGGMPELARLYLTYYKPGFHPEDLPSGHLLERWKTKFGAASEYLRATP